MLAIRATYDAIGAACLRSMPSVTREDNLCKHYSARLTEVTVSDKTARVHSVPPTADVEANDDFDLVDYCARPMCRREFRHNAGRGRRRDYCSEACRRLADRDYKRAKAMVEHFEKLSRRSRHDVFAFGRAADGEPTGIGDEVAIERASAALGRAEAVIRFASDGDERLVAELRELCSSIRPLLDHVRAG